MPSVKHANYGPGFLPTLVGIGFVIAGTALIATRVITRTTQTIKRTNSTVPATDPAPVLAKSGRIRVLFSLLTVLLGILFYILAVEWLGFLLVMGLLLFALIFWFDRKPGRAAMIAVVGTLVFHTFFYQFIRVPLPWGFLEDYAGYLTW